MKDTAEINKYPNSEGFTLENKISDEELSQFKKFINAQWYEKIKEINPNLASEIFKMSHKQDSHIELSQKIDSVQSEIRKDIKKGFN